MTRARSALNWVAIAGLVSDCAFQLPSEGPSTRKIAEAAVATRPQPSLIATSQIAPTIPAAPAPARLPIPLPSPSAGPVQAQPSSSASPTPDALEALRNLPIDLFFEESYRQLLLRNSEYLSALGLATELASATTASTTCPRTTDWKRRR